MLSQRDPIELSGEGVMTPSQVCKHQVCDYCSGRFGMVTHRWWGNKFCKRTSPRRISYVVSAFRFLHRESSLENLLVWRIQLVHRPALGVSSFSRAPGTAEINCMTCSTLSCTP